MNIKIDTTASPQSFSFNSQVVFLATQLIKFEGFDCSLSIEKIGDLGIEGEINSITELKNAQSTGNNPLSNNSTDLWKSLYNWTKFFYDNSMNVSDFHCILYVYSKNACNKDLAQDLEQCKSSDKFKKLIQRIKKDILKKDNYRRKNMSEIIPSKNYKDSKYYAEMLLSKELQSIFEQVLCQFQIVHSSQDYLKNLRNILTRKYQLSPSIIDEIMYYYLGWVQEKVIEAQENQLPVTIPTSDLEIVNKQISNKYLNNGKKFGLHESLLPSTSDVENEKKKMPMYIQQLNIISISDVRDAINSYLRYNLERNTWIRDGYLDNISDVNLIEYQRKYKDYWNRNKQIILIRDKKCTEIEQGQLIYYECMSGNSETLKNEVLDPVLQRGVLYEMSNYDFDNELSIGWHPNYDSLLLGGYKDGK